jgi:outer membrane protein
MGSIKKPLLAMAALLLFGSTVHAQKAGDNIFGIGLANMAPSVSLGELYSVGPAAPLFNAQTAGATASAGSVNTLSLSFLHMFTDNMATEFSLGIPPTMKLDVQLKSSDHPEAASADVLTPTLVAKYLFNAPADNFRPYLGLGLTYASFRNVNANTADPLVNALGGTSASLSSSWAPLYNLGLIYNFSEQLAVNFSVSYIPLKTTATFVGSGTTTTGTLELNPVDTVIRLGIKF